MKLRYFSPSIIVFLLVYALFVPARAQAYLDPGTGSLILQVVIAGLLGMSLTFRRFWRIINSLFIRIFKKTKKHEPTTQEVTNNDETP